MCSFENVKSSYSISGGYVVYSCKIWLGRRLVMSRKKHIPKLLAITY
jgi:hypothetical protein